MAVMGPTRAERAAQARLARALGEVGFALPGSLVERFTRCGSAGCRCKGDPPQLHGPYLQWSRSIGGRTVTTLLRPEQVKRYRDWFEAGRRLKALVRELEALTAGVAERDEGWDFGAQGRPRKASEPKGHKAPGAPM